MGNILINNQINILQHNNTTISSINDITNTIAWIFCDICSANSYLPSFNKIELNAERKQMNFNKSKTLLPYNTNFTSHELNETLHNTHKSCTGPDNISYIMLKNLSWFLK